MWKRPTNYPLCHPYPGAFGSKRKHDIHTGVDLYCPLGTSVWPVEPGIVVAVIPFTGPSAGSPWWRDTKAVLVEGETGVVVYGEISPMVQVGDMVSTDTRIGMVEEVLKVNKGTPTTMLHLELMVGGSTDVVWWNHHEKQPSCLLDPTPYLNESLNQED